MGLDSQAAFDVHSYGAKNRSIPELISYLKSAFQPPDFEEVNQILVAREAKIKEELSVEIERKEKEYETLEKKYSDLVLTKLSVEYELKMYKRECDTLKEQVTRLDEDRRLIGDRERKAEERYVKLLEEVNKQEESEKERFVGLQSRNRELACGKRKAEAEIEFWKRRFGGLESRVSRLEDDTAVLMSGESLFSRRVEEEVGGANAGSNEVIGEKEMSKTRECLKERDVGSSGASLNPLQIEEKGSNCSEKINGLDGGNSTGHPQTEGSGGLQDEGPHFIDKVHAIEVKESNSLDAEMEHKRPVRKELVFEAVSPNNLMVSSMPNNGEHAFGEIVEIIDSDDEIPTRNNYLLASKFKRKRESCTNVSEAEDDGDNDYDAYNPSGGKRKRKQLQRLIDEPRGLSGDYYLAAPASSGHNNVDQYVTPSRQNLLVLRQCEENIGAVQNSQYHLSGSFVDGFDSKDDSTGSSTDSKDDADSDTYINQLLSKLGKHRD